MTWTKILCAVDFSPCSDVAVERAAAVAAGSGASLTLVHVYAAQRPPTLTAEGLAGMPPDPEAEALAQAEPQLARVGRAAEATLGADRVETRLLAGKPEDEIVRLATDGRYDLVVVGTHGRTGVKRLVVGSVAEHVVRAAPVSVLVVRG